MVTQQLVFRGALPQRDQLASLTAFQADLLFVFAPPSRLTPALGALLTAAAPAAMQLGCASCAEISEEGVSEDSVVITALRFERPALRGACTQLQAVEDSFAAGQRLGAALAAPGLHTVVVLGQGVEVNGSALVRGMAAELGPAVLIAGGLAGDSCAFVRTPVLYGGEVSDRQIAAVGFCGAHLRVSHGAQGGWRSFGPVRRVTRAVGNQLFSLDDQPALGIYKRYLGDHAHQLPGSALLFPLGVLGEGREERGLIRTILGVDEATGSIHLAGDVAEGTPVRLMHASANALIEGAQQAAERAQVGAAAGQEGLALLVSCVGRRIVLGPRTDEEVEAVTEVFGPAVAVAGFYSHGEICPLDADRGESHLNNQTMAILLIQELSCSIRSSSAS